MAYPVSNDDEQPVMATLLNVVQRLRPATIVLSSLTIVAFVAVGDVITGTEISFSAFYLLPVVLASSGAGVRIGIRIAVITSITWLGAELATRAAGLGELLIPLWNVGVRFVVFALVVALLDALTTSVDHERSLSREDNLSGLPNSRAFYEMAEYERKLMARHSEPLTVAYIDIDNFKTINDMLGHSTGDVVLRSTAQTIRRVLRDVDLAGRLGGDEFAILLPRTDIGTATAILERVHESLLAEAAARSWPIGYSVGSVTFTTTPPSVDAMVSRSDELMYEVKRSGKNDVRAVTSRA